MNTDPIDLSGIDEERVGKAMRYLAVTDLSYAGAKADLEAAEIMRKRVRARIFLGADGTVAERQAKAEIHDETQAPTTPTCPRSGRSRTEGTAAAGGSSHRGMAFA